MRPADIAALYWTHNRVSYVEDLTTEQRRRLCPKPVFEPRGGIRAAVRHGVVLQRGPLFAGQGRPREATLTL